MMVIQRVGVLGTSRKENEHRIPIHPCHLKRIDPSVRARLCFERGYGERFRTDDAVFSDLAGGVADRAELLADSDLVILPKPVPDDLRELREGAVLWGWPHCVQTREIARIAIERRLTLIAWEAMFEWSRTGSRGVHVFASNNELAGYSGALHALNLLGIDGHYGPERTSLILAFGSVSRGALYALRGRGFSRPTILTQRLPHLVRDPLRGARHGRMRRGDGEGDGMVAVAPDGRERPLGEFLARFDVIVNGTLQDTDRPLMFLREGEVEKLRDGTLIVDISCDLGMGFPFARPTSFDEPIFTVGPATYYAVDHTPTYLWDAASWEISESVLPYLASIVAGPNAWAADETIRRALEIRDGVVENEKILTFQGLAAEYPHRPVV
jgi:alanine dehydrogenase